MARRQAPLNQTQIPVTDYGRSLDEDEAEERAYAEMFGEEALRRQREEFERRRACVCDSDYPMKVGKQHHKPGCPMVKPKAYL